MPPLDSRVTVNEIWHLALPSGTKLLGGQGGLLKQVEWAASLRASFPLFGTLAQGYMALAKPSLAQKLDRRVTASYLIQELYRAQASALVVDELLSSDDLALADQLSLPILLVPAGTELHQVERDILRALIDQEGQQARRELEAREHLQLVLSRDGLKAIVEDLAEHADAEVLLLDRGNCLVERSQRTQSAPQQSEAVFPIQVAGRVLGQIVLHLCGQGQPSLDALYARQAAEVCGLELLQQAAREEAEERLGADLIELLLDDKQPDDAVIARLQRMGYGVGTDHAHIVVALGADSPAGECAPARQGAQATDDAQSRSAAARDLVWLAERDGATTLTVLYHDRVLVFCAMDKSLSERTLHGWLRGALEPHAKAHCVAGVSRVASSIPSLRLAVSQAQDALELGKRISGRPSPYYYDELGLFRLLSGLRDRDELKRFYQETMGTLVEYDAAHHSDLVPTLDAFFAENANASQTARALFIHRNTLNYRLQRIVEITNLDLNDAEARLAFQLALRIHRLLG